MIRANGFEYEKFRYPNGELQIRLTDINVNKQVNIIYDYDGDESIFELMMLCFTLKENRIPLGMLLMDYVPYSRQDRVNAKGESLSIKMFCQIINSLGFDCVSINDPHSDVTSALLDRVRVFHQHDRFKRHFEGLSNYFLVSPDGGALKKIYKLAKEIKAEVIECSKNRNTTTGEITGVIVHYPASLTNQDLYIVDDICEGGRTFIEIAKEFKKNPLFTGKIILMVTHGFFSKGLEVFDGLIDEIYTKEGKVK